MSTAIEPIAAEAVTREDDVVTREELRTVNRVSLMAFVDFARDRVGSGETPLWEALHRDWLAFVEQYESPAEFAESLTSAYEDLLAGKGKSVGEVSDGIRDRLGLATADGI